MGNSSHSGAEAPWVGTHGALGARTQFDDVAFGQVMPGTSPCRGNPWLQWPSWFQLCGDWYLAPEKLLRSHQPESFGNLGMTLPTNDSCFQWRGSCDHTQLELMTGEPGPSTGISNDTPQPWLYDHGDRRWCSFKKNIKALCGSKVYEYINVYTWVVRKSKKLYEQTNFRTQRNKPWPKPSG